jgi:hypothetical protein
VVEFQDVVTRWAAFVNSVGSPAAALVGGAGAGAGAGGKGRSPVALAPPSAAEVSRARERMLNMLEVRGTGDDGCLRVSYNGLGLWLPADCILFGKLRAGLITKKSGVGVLVVHVEGFVAVVGGQLPDGMFSPSLRSSTFTLVVSLAQAAAASHSGHGHPSESPLVFKPTFRGERRGEGVGGAASIEGIHPGSLGDIGKDCWRVLFP